MILFTNEKKMCVLNLSQFEFLVATNTDSDMIEVFKAVINAQTNLRLVLCYACTYVVEL